MPIISTIGRRHWRVKLLIGAIHVVLICGAITMLYPFGLMVAGSTKSAVDTSESRLVPAFMRDETALYRKHVEGLFNESLMMMKMTYDSDANSFDSEVPPRAPNPRFVETWRDFAEGQRFSPRAYTCGYIQADVSRGVLPHNLRAFKRGMIGRFDSDIDRMNAAMEMSFVNWNAFYVTAENHLERRTSGEANAFYRAFNDFKAGLPPGECFFFSVEGYFLKAFLQTQYTKEIQAYNEAHGTAYVSWSEVHLDRRLPRGQGRTDKEREDWTVFVRSLLNLHWIRVDPEAAPLYRKFLAAKYGTIESVNRNYGLSCASFEEAPFTGVPPASGLALSDWDSLLQGWRSPDTGEMLMIPADKLRIDSVEFQFQDALRTKYGTIEALNAGQGTAFAAWDDILPPQRDLHYLDFQERTGKIRREFVRRNYLTVIDYMVLHGRGILNTAIYCGLAILAALTVNPLAAYALSRYKPPTTYKMLLFLMLTMAFPPMVTQIPNFLLLREFGMLNSFWALILPGVANGYMIFLLKGFFDSLPQELYESAELDGAGEIRIFWQITMSLSKPILAVVALQAFTFAYSDFMMALLVCQDSKMWTLMPWLYQLQMSSGPGVIFASLLIAAVPTFMVFAFCQNVIMRGIVVPVEK